MKRRGDRSGLFNLAAALRTSHIVLDLKKVRRLNSLDEAADRLRLGRSVECESFATGARFDLKEWTAPKGGEHHPYASDRHRNKQPLRFKENPAVTEPAKEMHGWEVSECGQCRAEEYLHEWVWRNQPIAEAYPLNSAPIDLDHDAAGIDLAEPLLLANDATTFDWEPR